jgi:hypothetical protein
LQPPGGFWLPLFGARLLKHAFKDAAPSMLVKHPLSEAFIFLFVSKSKNEIYLLQSTIRQLHRCEAVHEKTVFVDEKFQGSAIWKGDIEVFNLIGHPKAQRCFAWFHAESGKGVRPVALLERWPIVSPQAAIRFAIAFDIPVHKLPEPAEDTVADHPEPSRE